VFHDHKFIYRRDNRGKMGVECMECHKKFKIPWACSNTPSFGAKNPAGMVTPRVLLSSVGRN
jgi:hypothetical protein